MYSFSILRQGFSTVLPSVQDVFQESQSWQEANILLRRAQAQSLRVSFQRLRKMAANAGQ